jgi:hypothetical protein
VLSRLLVILPLLLAVAPRPLEATEAAPAPSADVAPALRELSPVQLGSFPYDPLLGGHIPDAVLALDGAQLRLHGTVTPWDLVADKVVRFALTDGQSCCFGGPPKIQHVVVVSFPAGMPLALSDGWISVEGRLGVKEERHDGFTSSIFTMAATAVSAYTKK